MSSDPYRPASEQPSDFPPSSPQEFPPNMPAGPAGGQPQGCAITAAQVLAAIMATIFVLVTPFVMLAFNAERIVFNPATYKQALNRMDFYEQIPTVMSATLAESIAENPEDNQALANLSKSDLQAILTGLVPQGWAQQQTESAIDQMFTWLSSEQEQPLSVKISMVELKQQLEGPEGTSALLKIMSSWPPCTDAQIAEAALQIQLGNVSDLPQCNPPDSLKGEVTDYFGEVTASAAASIPDTLDLAAPSGTPPNITPENDPRPALRVWRTVMLLSPLLSALLMLAIAGLAIRSWKSLSRWWGIPLVVAAILTGLLAVAMLPMRDMVTQAVTGQGSALPRSFEEVIAGVAGYVMRTIGMWLGGEAAVIGVGGLILFFSGFFGGQGQKTEMPPSY